MELRERFSFPQAYTIVKGGTVFMFRTVRKKVMIWTMLAMMMTMFYPGIVQADTSLKVNICDPDHPEGAGEGNTVNNVLSTPTVNAGSNRELGTVRISGKPGIAVPLQVGQKIMLTLPTGTAYMQPANASNFQKYVNCPETVDGQRNQLAQPNGLPGIKLISATPRSITIEITNIDKSAPIMVIDFLFNQENSSMVRMAPFVEKVEEYSAKPDENVKRLEFFQTLAGMVELFSPAPAGPEGDRAVAFSDTAGLDPVDLYDIDVLIKAGWLRGNSISLLRPHDYISRVEAVSLLGRIFPSPSGRAMFVDTIPAWAEYDINSAYARGLVSGYADGSFKPDKLLTKREALSLLQRSLETYSGKNDI